MTVFNEVHNSTLFTSVGVVSMLKLGVKMKSKRLLKKTKHIDVNIKFPKENISDYPFVEVHWLDIVGETGWQTFEQLKKSQLGRMVSRGWLVSRGKGVTRIFADYGSERWKRW